MGFRTNLWAIGLASIITLAGVSVLPASVAAADPTPTADPSPSPTADPSADPSPSPTADPSADPSATPTTDPSADPSATPTTDPSAAADPTPAPSATSAPTTITAVSVTVATTTVAARPSYAARVVRIALAQRGRRYVRGASGPRAFDCSGLVRYAYRHAGVSSHLGGGNSARGMLYWARIHHRASRSNPQVGDVVIYGNGSHAAIYIGNGRVISALNPRQGIRITRLHALRAPFTTFIHTHV